MSMSWLSRSLTENGLGSPPKGFAKFKMNKKQPLFEVDLLIFANLQLFFAFMPLF